MTDEKLCNLCGKPLDPGDPSTARGVTGWANRANPDEFFVEAELDTYAHGDCVDAEELALQTTTTG